MSLIRARVTIGLFLPALPWMMALGQSSSSSTPAPSVPDGFEQRITQIKHPVDWWNWGADLRIRNEYYENMVSLTDQDRFHEQDVIRYRGRLWTSLLPWEDVSLNGRLSAEPRAWMRPAFVGAYRGQTGMEWRYGIVDLLNIKWTNVFQQPLALTAGRQDMAFGDYWNWWLIADGTPGDGSWSFFLDSLRASYDIPHAATRLDLVYIHQNARPDEWIPTIGQTTGCYLTEQNEQGAVLYLSNQSLPGTQLDGYFISKHDNRELANGDNADIYTVGGRVVSTPWPHWQVSAEGAYQFGEKQDPTLKDRSGSYRWRDLDAFGFNSRLAYLFNDPLKNQVHLSFEFLSGDNPATEQDEMFDVLWGRWPRFSEGYIYSYIYETGGRVAQLNNIERLGCGWSFNPLPTLSLSACYNAWFAPESTPTRARNPALFTGTGNFRGHYMQAVLKHQFNKHVTAHLWSELVWPGDYYRDQSLMEFLRAEVQFTF